MDTLNSNSNSKCKIEDQSLPFYEDETVYHLQGRFIWSLRSKAWIKHLVLALSLLTFLLFLSLMGFTCNVIYQLRSVQAELLEMRQEIADMKQKLNGNIPDEYNTKAADESKIRLKRLATSLSEGNRGKPKSSSSTKLKRKEPSKSQPVKPKSKSGLGVRAIHLEVEGSQIPAGNLGADGAIPHWSARNSTIWSPFQLTNIRLDDQDGRVIVSQTGLYFVYAQLNYPEGGNGNNFEVRVMEQRADFKPTVIAHCSITKYPGAYNDVTCYTAVVRVLEAGDKVYVRQVEPDRIIATEEGQSFLGLVKLA